MRALQTILHFCLSGLQNGNYTVHCSAAHVTCNFFHDNIQRGVGVFCPLCLCQFPWSKQNQAQFEQWCYRINNGMVISKTNKFIDSMASAKAASFNSDSNAQCKFFMSFIVNPYLIFGCGISTLQKDAERAH